MGETLKLEFGTIELHKGDITGQQTDAIVNAANSGLMGGGGVDGAIHRAGGPSIKEECRKIVANQGRLPTGKAVMTSSGHLKARHVIHTVGPVYHGQPEDAALLASAYRESIRLALSHSLRSLAFPSISTGAYGYPVEEAAKVALSTVREEIAKARGGLDLVRFVLFDDRTYEVYRESLKALEG